MKYNVQIHNTADGEIHVRMKLMVFIQKSTNAKM